MVDKFDYAEMATDAEELIQEFGFNTTEATLIQSAEPSKSLPVDEKPTGEDVEICINCVRLPMNKVDKEIVIAAGFSAIHKYVKIIISAKGLSVDPVISNRIELTDNNYKIFQIKPIEPYTTPLIYICYCEQE